MLVVLALSKHQANISRPASRQRLVATLLLSALHTEHTGRSRTVCVVLRSGMAHGGVRACGASYAWRVARK